MLWVYTHFDKKNISRTLIYLYAVFIDVYTYIYYFQLIIVCIIKQTTNFVLIILSCKYICTYIFPRLYLCLHIYTYIPLYARGTFAFFKHFQFTTWNINKKKNKNNIWTRKIISLTCDKGSWVWSYCGHWINIVQNWQVIYIIQVIFHLMMATAEL